MNFWGSSFALLKSSAISFKTRAQPAFFYKKCLYRHINSGIGEFTKKIKKIAQDINKVVQGNNFTQFVIYLIIGLQYIE